MPVCCVISALAHFSVVSNGFLQFLYPSSAIDDDGRRQKRDANQKCSDFPAQDYVDSNGCVLDKLEKSAGTIDFSKNRPTDGSSQNQQNGDPSIGQLCRHLSASRLVSIAQIEGRVRGVGSEFVLACDMRFAARESAIFSQFEPSFGVIPGGGRRPTPRTAHGSWPGARSNVERTRLRR
jgi:Enoyl-CoA hydratase/isomerase